jgi:hypothetical protein
MSEGSNQDYQEEDITALREEYDNAKENRTCLPPERFRHSLVSCS